MIFSMSSLRGRLNARESSSLGTSKYSHASNVCCSSASSTKIVCLDVEEDDAPAVDALRKWSWLFSFFTFASSAEALTWT